MRHKQIALVIVALFSLGIATAVAEEKFIKLNRAEIATIERCLQLTSACQLNDGAIVQVAHGGKADAPALCVPYFAQHVALAWAVDFERTKNPRQLDSVGLWLEWCVTHQEAGGYWNHWDGTRRHYANTGLCDAWDSSCAMYLLVLERYQRVGGTPSTGMIEAAKTSLGCLEDLVDPSGLTIAKPDWPVMYLMDNVEAFGGAIAAGKLFDRLRRKDDKNRSVVLAKGLEKAIPQFWIESDRRFAWAKHPSGHVDVALKKLYPDGLAQLFGVAAIHPSEGTFLHMTKSFNPEMTSGASSGSERWLMAASQLGGKTHSTWRARVVADAKNFSADIYSHRSAIVILGLEDPGWLPSLLDFEVRSLHDK